MRALSLFSGGLDSSLATKLILQQGIEVLAISFSTPFCLCKRKSGCRPREMASNLGIALKVFPLGEECLEIVKHPGHGYGRNLNPCIDCRILMQKKAKKYMEEKGARFVVTGEVLGQRPMSQHREALRIIEKESNLEGLVLRPLSAQLLPLTVPEKEGWVKREHLKNFQGRSRKPQMALAKQFGIEDYPSPAGGCLLTEPGFSRKMKDLLKHGQLTMKEVALLKIGRHFRLNGQSKFIVGRNEEENKNLEGLAQEGDIIFTPLEEKGPVAIMRGGNIKEAGIETCGSIVSRYTDNHEDGAIKIACREISPKSGRDKEIPFTDGHLIESQPLAEKELEQLRI